MQGKCKKNLQEIVELWKHYYQTSKHEAGQSMCVSMNVFIHQRKLTNSIMSLR